MDKIQSIIVKQNTDDNKVKGNAIIRKKKAAKMSAYKITMGVIISYFTALISLVVLLGLCIYSAINKGNAGIIVGYIGVILLLSNIAGLTIGIYERKNDDAKQKHVIIGIVLNLFFIIIYNLLYWFG